LIFFARLSAGLAIGFYCGLHNFLELERLAFGLLVQKAEISPRGSTTGISTNL
jgi:hypothetical protein